MVQQQKSITRGRGHPSKKKKPVTSTQAQSMMDKYLKHVKHAKLVREQKEERIKKEMATLREENPDNWYDTEDEFESEIDEPAWTKKKIPFKELPEQHQKMIEAFLVESLDQDIENFMDTSDDVLEAKNPRPIWVTREDEMSKKAVREMLSQLEFDTSLLRKSRRATATLVEDHDSGFESLQRVLYEQMKFECNRRLDSAIETANEEEAELIYVPAALRIPTTRYTALRRFLDENPQFKAYL